MINYRWKRQLAAICGLVGSGFMLSGQPIFHFTIDDMHGVSNLPGVGATGVVDFGTVGTIGLNLTNTTTGWTESFITGVYVLKPLTDSGYRPDATLQTGPSQWFDVGDDGNFHEVWSGMGTGLGNSDEYLYFGSEISRNPDLNGVAQGSSAAFSFSMDALPVGDVIDWDNYLSSNVPHIFIRWQAIGPGDESAKGYAYFSPVPEPSVIAPFGVLGLIGFALWRRRQARTKA